MILRRSLHAKAALRIRRGGTREPCIASSARPRAKRGGTLTDLLDGPSNRYTGLLDVDDRGVVRIYVPAPYTRSTERSDVVTTLSSKRSALRARALLSPTASRAPRVHVRHV